MPKLKTIPTNQTQAHEPRVTARDLAALLNTKLHLDESEPSRDALIHLEASLRDYLEDVYRPAMALQAETAAENHAA